MINKFIKETFETTTETLTDSDRATLDDIKNRLSTALTVLMSIAKSHTTKLSSSTPCFCATSPEPLQGVIRTEDH
jgi:hypothetical protein